MEKLIVKVCSGTMCYVMGGAELQLLGDALPAEISNSVDIHGVTCLDCCNKGEGKAPFVIVGDTVVSGANIANVMEEIHKQLYGN